MCIECNNGAKFNFCPNCGIKLGVLSRCCGGSTKEPCIDIEGNQYKTMILGDKEWMIEDLRVTKYNDGSSIKNIECPDCWKNLKTPAMCFYDNDKSKNVLYNWFAVDTGKLAPKGWHVATDNEWTEAEKYIQKNHKVFNALPGGSRGYNGSFFVIGSYGYWWSATAFDATNSWYRGMNYSNAYVYHLDFDSQVGFSARCVRDY